MWQVLWYKEESKLTVIESEGLEICVILNRIVGADLIEKMTLEEEKKFK